MHSGESIALIDNHARSFSSLRSDLADAEFERANRPRSRSEGRLALARVSCLSWEPTPNQDDAANGWPACFFA